MDGYSLFLYPNAVKSTHTLICGPLSTKVFKPSILPPTNYDYYDMVMDPNPLNRLYTIS